MGFLPVNDEKSEETLFSLPLTDLFKIKLALQTGYKNKSLVSMDLFFAVQA